MQPPRRCFTFFRELLYHSCVFFEYLLSFIIVWPYIKWRKCRSHLTSSFVRHVGITDCRNLKSAGTNLGAACSGTTFIPVFIRIHPMVLELNHVDRRTDRQSWLALHVSVSCTSCEERVITSVPLRVKHVLVLPLNYLWHWIYPS
jgi:hypothetical protein